MKLLFILLLGLGFSQTKLETRQYIIPLNLDANEYYWIDMADITGYNLSNAIIVVVSLGDNYSSENINMDYGCINVQGGGINLSSSGLYANGTFPYFEDSECHLQMNHIESPFEGDIILNITAEFPEEDTGYIEEGFEFCLNAGANLVSYPCDNPISVSASLPQGSENFITSIIGQGVATEYNPALGWIGSLAEFTPGSGYWFKSNESLCFEYECVEN